MGPIARISLRRPRTTLAVWLGLIAVLALLGSGVEGRLRQGVLTIPGSEPAHAHELARQQFGPAVTIAVLLQGPADELDRQGPALVTALVREDDLRALSPWDRGKDAARLRPNPETAMVLAAVERPIDEAFFEGTEKVRGIVDKWIEAPVEARLTGQPAIGEALKDESYAAARRAERIALPILLLVLLLVFRSPVAAAVPALSGIGTVLGSFGVIWLLAGWLEIDPIAVSLASMMGLALGVDYSLLIVSRFREELARGSPVPEAVRVAGSTAGRTVRFAGAALIVALIVALLLAPGNLLLSAAVGVIVATVLSILGAAAAMPAALLLLGHNVDRWHIGRRRRRHAAASAAGAALRRPGLAVLLIGGALLVLASSALAVQTGPPDVRQLPPDNAARQDFEAVRKVMGPGWAAPFDVILVADQGTLTERTRLRRLQDWQNEIADDSEVALVVGPGRLSAASRQARRGAQSLRRAERGLARIHAGLTQAEGGVAELWSGADRGAAAADAVAGGAGDAAGASARLSTGLGRTEDGAAGLAAKLASAKRGAKRIASGGSEAASGARQLASQLQRLRKAVDGEATPGAEELAAGLTQAEFDLGLLREPAQAAEQELATALDALLRLSVDPTDPDYQQALESVGRAAAAVSGRDPRDGSPVAPDYDGLDAELAAGAARLGEAANGAARLAAGSRRLGTSLRRLTGAAGRVTAGAERLTAGAERLTAGTQRLHAGAEQLAAAVATLRAGAGSLEAGLQDLAGGSGALAGGLDEGSAGAAELDRGTQRLVGGSARLSGRFGAARARQQRTSPGLFESGYYVLAGIDGARRREREQAEFAVNVDHGGEAGHVTVIPVHGPNDPETKELRDRLSAQVAELGSAVHADAALGGSAAALAEYDDATASRLVLLIASLAVVTYFVLLPIFRSLLLPLVAVLLNMLSVGVAFGVLALLFDGSDPVLGGPGYVDAVAITGIYTVIFGLSIDYQVFLVARMREGYARHAETRAAITYGIERTAGVVTGAAAIMSGVFLAFAMTPVANTRQFGVGLTVAVLIDATVVRLILLPSLMRLLDRWCWWLPPWLDRRMPTLDVEGSASS
jgi:RND superfamily putative drug exporter